MTPGTGEILEVVWENQRKRPGGDYKPEFLMESDRPAWSHADGRPCPSCDQMFLVEGGYAPWDPGSGAGWSWMSEWCALPRAAGPFVW
jgi:hypothetical protein